MARRCRGIVTVRRRHVARWKYRGPYRLVRNRYNQYGAAALTALTASGVYVLLAALMRNVGLEIVNFPAGFMGSVLFLVPGFPLVGGLFDLLQYKTIAGVSRLAYGTMILLAVALGLSIVIAIAGSIYRDSRRRNSHTH